MTLTLAIAALLASAAPTGNMVVEAVAKCAAAIEPAALDIAPLTSDGWTEGAISGVKPNAEGSVPVRMFNKADAGAVIVLKYPPDGSKPACHVVFRRPKKAIDELEDEISGHFGGQTLKIGAGLSLFDTSGRPIMASLSSRPDKGQVLADVAILPQKPKPVTK